MDLSTIEAAMKGKARIVQEWVPGKQVTLAHVISSPDEQVLSKLGLIDMGIVPGTEAVGILALWPSEVSPVAADVAQKAGGVDLAYIDRYCGTLVFTGKVGRVKTALTAICDALRDKLGFSVCAVTAS